MIRCCIAEDKKPMVTPVGNLHLQVCSTGDVDPHEVNA